MLTIEYMEKLDEKTDGRIGVEFEKHSSENGVICNYKPFTFVAKENEEIIGIITGQSYYEEVHVNELIVYGENRNKQIGSKLIKAVEDHHKDGGFENINLTTHAFQAPDFYRKCGFQIEFIRKNKEDPKLNKYFFIKYF